MSDIRPREGIKNTVPREVLSNTLPWVFVTDEEKEEEEELGILVVG